MELEDQYHIEVYGLGSEIYGAVVLACKRCPWRHEIAADRYAAITLADLNQRADEHTEVCR